jgi:hypothetical protein
VTTHPYPHDLLFDLPVTDSRRDAIVGAATALELPIAADGTLIRVTVRSPQETYRFGRKTGDLLQGAPAPIPVTPVAPETAAMP